MSNNLNVHNSSKPVVTTNNTTSYNPVQRISNALERSPQSDGITFANNKGNISQKKPLLTLGGLAVGLLGAILGAKNCNVNKTSTALKQIEQKFLVLQDNIPEVQKTFNELFLRKDITEEETIELLNRYKEIEELGVTGRKEEYINAVFNEAKRNFGFENSKICLNFIKGKASANGKTQGGAARLCSRVDIDPNIPISKIQGIIHHEMRHLKQNYYAINYDPQSYKQALKSDINIKISDEQLEEVLDDCLNDILKTFNLECFDKKNVPEELFPYAEKCIDGCTTYVDGHKDFKSYYNNFKEVDARHAGDLIEKLLTGRIQGGNK